MLQHSEESSLAADVELGIERLTSATNTGLAVDLYLKDMAQHDIEDVSANLGQHPSDHGNGQSEMRLRSLLIGWALANQLLIDLACMIVGFLSLSSFRFGNLT